MTNEFDTLLAYAQWFTQQPFAIPPTVQDGVVRVGSFSGLVLHRSGRHQTQLWIADPNSVIPEHGHPNVDSIPVIIAGDIQFKVLGEPAVGAIRVRPGEKHSATIGPAGASFIIFQEFTNGKPVSVEQDWEGEPLSQEHARSLRAQVPPQL